MPNAAARGETRPRQPTGRRRYLRAPWTLSIFFLLCANILFYRVVDVSNRGRDHVRSAGPFSQIDASAAFAAEREVGATGFNRFLASRTRNARALAPHGWHDRTETSNGASELDDTGDQVVVVRLGDAAAIELAFFWRLAIGIVVDEDFAVDFGRVHRGASLEQEIGFV